VHASRREFRYGSYPGELLPLSLTQPFRTHVRLLSILRFDLRGQWVTLPTFIPTHSSLDFPEELEGGPERFRYRYWPQSRFSRIWVSRSRNLAHDQTGVDWIDPRTGKGAPNRENAVLWEISEAF